MMMEFIFFGGGVGHDVVERAGFACIDGTVRSGNVSPHEFQRLLNFFEDFTCQLRQIFRTLDASFDTPSRKAALPSLLSQSFVMGSDT